jgi:hypothetical protein
MALPATLRPADFVKIVAEISRRCANDPERLLPTMERDQNLRVLIDSAISFERLWETFGAAVARKKGYIRAPDGFRDALTDWRRRWRHAHDEPLDRAMAEIVAEMDGTPFDPAKLRRVPRDTWRLAPAREWDPEEAVRHPWLHLAEGLASAESFLDSAAEVRAEVDSEHAAATRAAVVVLAALAEHFGGWSALQQRLDQFEPIAVPLDVAAAHGETDHASLLRAIRECYQAWLFGLPIAAVALARRVIEITLRDHWLPTSFKNASLAELMDAAQELYPDQIAPDFWGRLRQFANRVVHANAQEFVALERDLPRLIELMRKLIERAPRSPTTSA